MKISKTLVSMVLALTGIAIGNTAVAGECPILSDEITSKYDEVYGFACTDGLVSVMLNEKYGFVDSVGTEVIPIEYDSVWSFSEGLVWVELNDKWGVIDKTGKVIVEPKYDSFLSFNNGYASVELLDRWGSINR